MRKLLVGLVLVMGLLSACVPLQPAVTVPPAATSSPDVAAGAERTIQHALGETVIPENPQRILAMGEEWLLADLIALGIQPLASTVNLPDAVPGIPAEALAGIQLFSSTQINIVFCAWLTQQIQNRGGHHDHHRSFLRQHHRQHRRERNGDCPSAAHRARGGRGRT